MSSLVKDRVLKRILMVGTGGTIACKSSEDGLKPLLTSEELLRYVPDTKEFCKVDSLQVINIDSTNMQPRYWLMIAPHRRHIRHMRNNGIYRVLHARVARKLNRDRAY